MIVEIRRFDDKFYGVNSEINISSYADFQDIKVQTLSNELIQNKYQNFDNYLKTQLSDLIQDENFVNYLLSHPNEKYDNMQLVIGDGIYMLVFYGDLKVNLNITAFNQQVEAVLQPDCSFILLEIYKK